MRIKIRNKYIENNLSPSLIAEISCNHCGNKKLFLKHILMAKRSGADFVKIQTYEPEDMTIKSYDRKFKVKKGSFKGKYLWDIYKKACTPYDWHYDAFKLAKKNNIILFSSPFSIKAVDFLEKFQVPLYKIASMELTDLSLVDKIASTKKPVIVSTGNSSIKEIKKTVKRIEKYHKKIILLHCVSDYPTKIDNCNLFEINNLSKIFPKYMIGLSDHTNNIYSSIASVFFNSVVIEKHFKLSKNINSLDKDFSLNPDQFKALKHQISIYFKLKSLKKNRKKNKDQNFKRSIFSKNFINKGDIFSEKNIISLRPKIGIDSSEYFNLLGKKSIRNIEPNKPIFTKYIK